MIIFAYEIVLGVPGSRMALVRVARSMASQSDARVQGSLPGSAAAAEVLSCLGSVTAYFQGRNLCPPGAKN